MNNRRIWALVAFVIGLAAAMFVYLRTRPAVSDDALRDAVEEVERIRASLDNIECERPAILGPPSLDAMPLEELLRVDGPFGECWEAVDVSAQEYLRRTALVEGFRFEYRDGYRASSLERIEDPDLLHAVSVCTSLSEEVGRQAQAPNRCMPPPRSGAWVAGTEMPKIKIAHAVALIARRGNMSPEDRLRLIVQGMATARDIQQGPAGEVSAMMGASAERILAHHFAALVDDASPSAEVSAELNDALGDLAELPLDAHAYMVSAGVENFDATEDAERSESESRFITYATATATVRVAQSCPRSISVEACLAQLPYPRPAPVNAWMERLLGDAYTLDFRTQDAHANLDWEPEVRRMESTRHIARALQELLRWSAERAERRCPEVSSWDPGSDQDRQFVDGNDENLYQLVTPSPERHAFYFSCPARLDSLEHTIDLMLATQGL